VQAQTLRTKKTKIVGVVVLKVASASIGRVVEGILSVLNESVYQMLLAVTQNNPKKEVEYLAAFQERQVDGGYW
jgi:LacI family sucrose operon transcriptional repressor